MGVRGSDVTGGKYLLTAYILWSSATWHKWLVSSGKTVQISHWPEIKYKIK